MLFRTLGSSFPSTGPPDVFDLRPLLISITVNWETCFFLLKKSTMLKVGQFFNYVENKPLLISHARTFRPRYLIFDKLFH